MDENGLTYSLVLSAEWLPVACSVTLCVLLSASCADGSGCAALACKVGCDCGAVAAMDAAVDDEGAEGGELADAWPNWSVLESGSTSERLGGGRVGAVDGTRLRFLTPPGCTALVCAFACEVDVELTLVAASWKWPSSGRSAVLGAASKAPCSMAARFRSASTVACAIRWPLCFIGTFQVVHRG